MAASIQKHSHEYISDMARAIKNLEEFNFDFLIDRIHETLRGGRSIAFIGNGGSAALADHASCDFLKNLSSIRDMGFECNSKIYSFGSLLSLFSALNNDVGHENSYSWCVKNILQKGDLIIAISSSGESSNIINAVEVASISEVEVITLTGFYENTLHKSSKHGYCTSSNNYGIVEDTHGIILHSFAQSLFKLVE